MKNKAQTLYQSPSAAFVPKPMAKKPKLKIKKASTPEDFILNNTELINRYFSITNYSICEVSDSATRKITKEFDNFYKNNSENVNTFLLEKIKEDKTISEKDLTIIKTVFEAQRKKGPQTITVYDLCDFIDNTYLYDLGCLAENESGSFLNIIDSLMEEHLDKIEDCCLDSNEGIYNFAPFVNQLICSLSNNPTLKLLYAKD